MQTQLIKEQVGVMVSNKILFLWGQNTKVNRNDQTIKVGHRDNFVNNCLKNLKDLKNICQDPVNEYFLTVLSVYVSLKPVTGQSGGDPWLTGTSGGLPCAR